MTRSYQGLLMGIGLLALCGPAFGQDSRFRKPVNDVERLQGTWLAELEPGLQGRLVLDKGRIHYVHLNGQRETVIWDGHFAINEKANPKQMDWTPLRRNNRNVPANLAIYRLEGDLLLVIGSTEGPRPTEFYSGGGGQRPKTVIFYRQQNAGGRRSIGKFTNDDLR